MKVLGLIPARAGSQRVPGKNMELVGGMTLVSRAIATAQHSRAFETIAITTDSWRIGQHATDLGAVAIARPDELSRGDQPMMISVVKHALEELLPHVYDAVCLLQPTSPLRDPADIRRCVQMLEVSGGDSVISVTAAEDSLAFLVRHARRLEAVPEVVVPNGAVFLMRVHHLENGGHWFNGHVYAYVMPKDRSLDIDTQQDLELARFIVENRDAPQKL